MVTCSIPFRPIQNMLLLKATSVPFLNLVKYSYLASDEILGDRSNLSLIVKSFNLPAINIARVEVSPNLYKFSQPKYQLSRYVLELLMFYCLMDCSKWCVFHPLEAKDNRWLPDGESILVS